MAQPQRETTIVVIEYGASWPRWLDTTPNVNTAVVAQHYDGKAAALLTQIKTRLERLQQDGAQVKTLVYVCNGHNEPAARSARASVVRGLFGPLGCAEGSQLVLSNDEIREPAALAFTALVATLESDAARAGVKIGLRLGASPPLFGSFAALLYTA
jgi:hypothetical protein